MVESPGGQVGLESAGYVLGPVVGEHGPDPDPRAPMGAQDVVGEADGVVVGDRAEQNRGDGLASEDLTGGELVGLSDALPPARVDGVQADQLIGATVGRAGPNGSSSRAASATGPVVAARASRWERCPSP